MTQSQQPSSQHQTPFFLVSKGFSLYLVAFITLIYLVIYLLQRGTLLTVYILFPVFAAGLTFPGIRFMQEAFRTSLIRKYGARTRGIVLKMKTQLDSNGVPNRGALVEYATHKGAKQQWFYYNNMLERRYVTVLYNPYAPDQVMLEQPLSILDKVPVSFFSLFIGLSFLGGSILLLLTGL